MSFIKDRISEQVSSCLLPLEFETPVRGGKDTIGELVASYLPKAFDILTRGINNSSFREKVVEALPIFSKTGIADEICSYIDNRSTMSQILDDLPERDKVLSDLVKWLENGSWEDPLLQRENLDQYLLEAVRKGVITQYEFSSLTLHIMAKKTAKRDPVVLQFIEGNQVNPAAEKVIKESFVLKPTSLLPNPGSVLTDEQFQKFIEELEKFPRTDQMISLIPFDGERTIFPILTRLGLNLFGRVHFPQTFKAWFFGKTLIRQDFDSMMVAPLGMVQAFLNIKFGDNAVELLPAIGPVPISDLAEGGLDGTRVVGLDNSILKQLTGLEFPVEADGFPAPGIYFPYHDACFHGYLCSSVPHPLRQRSISFYNFAEKNREGLVANMDRSAEKGLFLENLGFAFVDLECPLFRPEFSMVSPGKTRNPLSSFWVSWAGHIVAQAKDNLPIFGDILGKWGKAMHDQGMIGKEDVKMMRSEIERMRTSPSEFQALQALEFIAPPTD